jgi:hypothetical protein
MDVDDLLVRTVSDSRRTAIVNVTSGILAYVPNNCWGSGKLLTALSHLQRRPGEVAVDE